jgi:RNA polymerase sigma-70 factor (ECF subfamily)
MRNALSAPSARITQTVTSDAGDSATRFRTEIMVDSVGFDELYDRHLGEIYGYCLRRLGNVQAAEDATSLIFHKALISLPSVRGAVRAWLFGIAHHVVADHFRVRAAERPLNEALDVLDPSPSPEERVLADDAGRMLRVLLIHLVPDQRRVIELRLAGLTSAEIGYVLGRTPGWVDVTQYRAIARLKSVIASGKEESDGSA